MPPPRSCQIPEPREPAAPRYAVDAVDLHQMIAHPAAAGVSRVEAGDIFLHVARHVGDAEGGVSTRKNTDGTGLKQTCLGGVGAVGLEGPPPGEFQAIRAGGGVFPLGFGWQTETPPGFPGEPDGIGVGVLSGHGIGRVIGALARETAEMPTIRQMRAAGIE